MHAIHHVAVTASDFERSLKFYELLGFETLSQRDMPEKGKKVALMRIGGSMLELFWYRGFTNDPAARAGIGNNVKAVGMKHFALRVASLEQAHKDLTQKGIQPVTVPALGDSGYRFFFIRDPDGIWIEFVQDDLHVF